MKLTNNQIEALAEEFISKIKTKRQEEKEVIMNSIAFKKRIASIIKIVDTPAYSDFCMIHGVSKVSLEWLSQKIFDKEFSKELTHPEIPYTSKVISMIHLGTIEAKTVKELMEYLEKSFH